VARALLAAVLFALVLPAAALGATVSVQDSDDVYVGRYLDFAAAPGEANRVTVRFADGRASVRDAGAPLSVGAGCEALSAHAATCTVGSYLTAQLGDGNDTIAVTLSATEGSVSLTGGPGDDVLDASRVEAVGPRASESQLDGGPGDDTVRGGRKADDLFGGAGADVLRGGPGFDTLSGDGPSDVPHPGRDLLDGGVGTDTVTYEERHAPVSVDLREGRGGRRGEGDRLRRIEDIGGGNAADILRGDASANKISADRLTGEAGGGGSGRDVLVGRGGPDQLMGITRGTVFLGGGGNDVIFSLSRRDPLGCGPGQDTLAQLSKGRLVPAGCEWIAQSNLLSLSRGAVVGQHVVLMVRRTGPRADRCAGSVALRSPTGVPYGGAAWAAGGPREPTVTISLTAAGRAAARQHRVAVVRTRGSCASAATWRIRL
jgi:Ca2+-binding RTX toxin-like protein